MRLSPIAFVLIVLFAPAAQATNEEEVEGMPQWCSGVQCESLPGDGNCGAAAECCGCDIYEPGGPCYLASCGVDGDPDEGGPTDDGPDPPPSPTVENCVGLGDEDHDGEINCEDSDCWTYSVILGATPGALAHVSKTFIFTANVIKTCPQTAGLEFKWSFGDGTETPFLDNTATISKKYTTPGAYLVEVEVFCPGCATTTAIAFQTVTAWDAKIASPSTAAVHKIVFEENTPGGGGATLAHLGVAATVNPPSAAAEVQSKLRWRLRRGTAHVYPAQPTWLPESGGAGIGTFAQLDFYAWPSHNDKFGAYVLYLERTNPIGAAALGQVNVDFYYDPKVVRSATSGGMTQSAPNWFHYWTQAFAKAHPLGPVRVKYNGSPKCAGTTLGTFKATGEYPGETSADVLAMKNQLNMCENIFKNHRDVPQYNPFTDTEYLGIEAYFATALHELRHREQFTICDEQLWDDEDVEDALALGGVPALVYKHGWMVGRGNQGNHFSPGLDQLPGRPGVDDDGDGLVDLGLSADNFPATLGYARELNRGFGVAIVDDLPLFDDPAHKDWCQNLGPVPVRPDHVPDTDYTNNPFEIDAHMHPIELSPKLFHEDWSVGGPNDPDSAGVSSVTSPLFTPLPAPSCIYDCGDGIIQYEECDDGNTKPGDGCSPSCTAEKCGNGYLDHGEECDDGNGKSGDGCDEGCLLEAYESCGDGRLDKLEMCDDGGRKPGDGCSPWCLLESCGNGVVDRGEECDDGGRQLPKPFDSCTPRCTKE